MTVTRENIPPSLVTCKKVIRHKEKAPGKCRPPLEGNRTTSSQVLVDINPSLATPATKDDKEITDGRINEEVRRSCRSHTFCCQLLFVNYLLSNRNCFAAFT